MPQKKILLFATAVERPRIERRRRRGAGEDRVRETNAVL